MLFITDLTKVFVINIFFFLVNFIEFNQCRRTLRDYIIINSSRIPNRLDSFSIYDYQQQLLCRMESFNTYSYRLTQLINYPLKQTIASIEHRWFPLNLRNSLMMIYDDQYDQWFSGSIIEQIKSQQIEFELEYLNQYYRMEIKPLTMIIEIRQLNRTNLLLSRFVPQIKLNQEQIHPSLKYRIEIYTNRLPDPFYFLAFDYFYSYFQRFQTLKKNFQF